MGGDPRGVTPAKLAGDCDRVGRGKPRLRGRAEAGAGGTPREGRPVRTTANDRGHVSRASGFGGDQRGVSNSSLAACALKAEGHPGAQNSGAPLVGSRHGGGEQTPARAGGARRHHAAAGRGEDGRRGRRVVRPSGQMALRGGGGHARRHGGGRGTVGRRDRSCVFPTFPACSAFAKHRPSSRPTRRSASGPTSCCWTDRGSLIPEESAWPAT